MKVCIFGVWGSLVIVWCLWVHVCSVLWPPRLGIEKEWPVSLFPTWPHSHVTCGRDSRDHITKEATVPSKPLFPMPSVKKAYMQDRNEL